jgi:hypothetical protein
MKAIERLTAEKTKYTLAKIIELSNSTAILLGLK